MKFVKIAIICSVSYYLVACVNVPKQKSTTVVEKVESSTIAEEIETESQLKTIAEQYSKNKNVSERNYALLELSNTYLKDGNCDTANIIVKHTQNSIKKTKSTNHLAYANLIKAECELLFINQLSTLANKQPILDMIEQWLQQISFDYNQSDSLAVNKVTELMQRKQIAVAKFLGESNQFENALNTLMKVQPKQSFIAESPANDMVWDWMSNISPQQRMQLASTYPVLSDYKVLLETIEDSTINDIVRQANITQWIATSASLVVANNLPAQVKNYLSRIGAQKQNLAVLLPMTGRLAEQGLAIKKGILSAYYKQLQDANSASANTSIEFIDTGSSSDLNESLTLELLAPFDTIIGPLLRSHISQMQDFDLAGKKQLLLNQINPLNEQLNSIYASFALSPEQEAEQLVGLMRSRNIKKPVIISDGSSITERMHTAFVSAWKESQVDKSSNINIQHIRYSDNKNMRVGITSALDVLQSQKRIQQLSNLSQEKVTSVTRNRRDIDAFVVFAKPNDLELINPIIEASISLFTNDHVPVFATSYSYDHKQNKNSQRDLRNLVFIDMPWLLPAGREESLALQVNQLFNQPPSAFLRLFAFGYDALSLANNLVQLQTFDHMSLLGLSGKLSVGQNQVMQRDLSWIAITETSN